MFSPFTSWKIQLKKSDHQPVNLVGTVKKFIDNIQLTLEGGGVYISTAAFSDQSSKQLPLD